MWLDNKLVTYIYLLLHEPDGGIPHCYVGKADDPWKRAEDHVKESLKGGGTPKRNWIRKLVKQGQSFVTSVLEQVTEDVWQERESYWIAHFRNLGYKVFNSTNGGEGMKDPGPELRKKRSEQFRKMWADPEYRKKRTEASIKRFKDPEFIEKMRKFNKKRCNDPEHRKKLSEQFKDLWEDPEYRKRMEEIRKRVHQSQEYREKMRGINGKRCRDPENRKRVSEQTKKRWADPEYKKRVSEAIKAGQKRKREAKS